MNGLRYGSQLCYLVAGRLDEIVQLSKYATVPPCIKQQTWTERSSRSILALELYSVTQRFSITHTQLATQLVTHPTYGDHIATVGLQNSK